MCSFNNYILLMAFKFIINRRIESSGTAFRSTCNLPVPLRCNYAKGHVTDTTSLLLQLCPEFFSVKQLMSLSPLFALFLSLFFEKKNHKDVQAIERLTQCQFSFWAIPFHHSDLRNSGIFVRIFRRNNNSAGQTPVTV